MRGANSFRTTVRPGVPETARRGSASFVLAGAVTLACSGAALAALPALPAWAETAPSDHQWDALAIAPLSANGATGLRMVATERVETLDRAPLRAHWTRRLIAKKGEGWSTILKRGGASPGDIAKAAARLPPPLPGETISLVFGKGGAIERFEGKIGLGASLVVARTRDGFATTRIQQPIDQRPLRISGRVGDGLYWALRAAGASAALTAEYLAALSSAVDVGGDIAPNHRFELILASRTAAGSKRQLGQLLYAGLDRGPDEPGVRLVRWSNQWVDAEQVDRPGATNSALAWPVAGHVSSSFGYRVHPILRFTRFHSGVDFAAGWGSPIVASADGEVVRAGWAGGYGRQVRIAHGGGLQSSYSHMSQMTVSAGAFVRRGELIGYVGSSGLSTGPHLHYEVLRGGRPVNPLGVRFDSAPLVDHARATAVKARLKALFAAVGKSV